MSDDTDIILPSDDRAATYRTDITGWVSRDGKYCGDDERLARLVGATHRACADCGVSTLKTYMICPACRDKRAEQRYLALPQAEWDGEAMLYSEAHEEYFTDMECATEHAECHDVSLADLRLVICEPNRVRPLDMEYCSDDLPMDADDGPEEVKAAIDAFNEAVKDVVLSWSPGKTRPIIEDDAPAAKEKP